MFGHVVDKTGKKKSTKFLLSLEGKRS